MPYTIMSIKFSVGDSDAFNFYNDVTVVQGLINDHYLSNAAFAAALGEMLSVDGDCGSLTKTAVRTFQTVVMGKSAHWADGRVDPGGQTWRALNGNLPAVADIAPAPLDSSTSGAVGASLGNTGDYSAFRQGNYGTHLGNSSRYDSNKDGKMDSSDKFATIASHGCCLCSLTMAATAIGSRVPAYWPEGVTPKSLTPLVANTICKKAGAYSGYSLNMKTAADALGMTGTHYGFDTALPSNAVDILLGHLAGGNPVALHVDYKKGATGDHWVLATRKINDFEGDVEAIDPASGGRMKFTRMDVFNSRYAARSEAERTGILFGLPAYGGTSQSRREKQYDYIVVRFMTLRSVAGTSEVY
jgi:peptidoglycan hydrolase-like protein with peptidoglycan-binding domain